jgi:hypothetical protein
MQTDGNFVVSSNFDPPSPNGIFPGVRWASGTNWVTQRVTTGNRLTTGQWLATGDYLVSDDRRFVAMMQEDGNFVLYYATYPNSPTVRPSPDYSRPYWTSNSGREQGQYIAVLREDGYFILYRGPARGETDPQGYWYVGNQSTGSLGPALAALMQDDGNFVLSRQYGSQPVEPYWDTGTGRAANRVTGRSYLRSGEELDAQDCLVSTNGLYFAVMQGDSKFVLYHTTSDANASPDFSRPYYTVCSIQGVQIEQNRCFATMQTDGNFVLYYRGDAGNEDYWHTGTAHSSPGQYIAVLHDNGNFAIYSGSDPNQVSENTRLWQSNTAIDPNALTMQILSGNNQNLKGIVNPVQYTTLAPLVVQVKHQNGQPAPNMPVEFALEATSGDMILQITPGNTSHVTLNTDPNGIASLSQASVYCYLNVEGCAFTIIAQTADGNSVSFDLTIIPS